jgi:hypothetical protein
MYETLCCGRPACGFRTSFQDFTGAPIGWAGRLGRGLEGDVLEKVINIFYGHRMPRPEAFLGRESVRF